MGINIKGLEGLQRKLDRLQETMQKTIVKIALREVCTEILLPAIKSKVPVVTGALLAGLKVTGRASKGTIGASVVDSAIGSEFHGSYVELGTKHEAPQKYMRASLDENADRILASASAKIGSAIEETSK